MIKRARYCNIWFNGADCLTLYVPTHVLVLRRLPIQFAFDMIFDRDWEYFSDDLNNSWLLVMLPDGRIGCLDNSSFDLDDV